MYSLKDIVSSFCVITTILLFLSGIPVCKQYVVNKTTGESSPLPFICGIWSCSLWLFYGLTKHDDKIVLVNTIGATLMMAYTVTFYIHSHKKSSLLRHVLFLIIMFILLIYYAVNETDSELLLSRLGLMACSLTILQVASPLGKFFHVVKVKSTECLPFPMIFMSFVVSASWLMYGLLENDIYITVQNFISAALALLQLSLFVIFPSKTQLCKEKGISLLIT